MKNKTKELGLIFRQRRQEKHMTMSQVAEKVNVAESTISRYENGSRDMPIKLFFDICDVLDLRPNDIQEMLRK